MNFVLRAPLPAPRASPVSYRDGCLERQAGARTAEHRHWRVCLGEKGAMEGCEAGCDRDGVDVPKAALVVAWRRGWKQG